MSKKVFDDTSAKFPGILPVYMGMETLALLSLELSWA